MQAKSESSPLLWCWRSGFLLAPQLYSCAFIILRINLECQNNGWAKHAKRWTSVFQKLQCSPKLQLDNLSCSGKTSLHLFFGFVLFFRGKNKIWIVPWRKPIARSWSLLCSNHHDKTCLHINEVNTASCVLYLTHHRDQTSWVSLGFFWLRCKPCWCLLETDMSGAVPPNYGSHAEFSIGIGNCQFININLYFGPRM